MSQDPVRELQDLKAVHEFYTALLEKALHHPVPTPDEVKNANPKPEVMLETISTLQRWLNLLDLAITPPMVRDALPASSSQNVPEALLRYYTFKSSHTPLDRDKADSVSTYLYRNPAPETGRIAPNPAGRRRPITDQGNGFESEVNLILGGLEPLPLPEQYSQLLREFDFIQEEVDDIAHFDQLMDSGVAERVRGIKESLGDTFYHPRALATLAAYNNFFGSHFDELFREAAQQIKTFAAKVQEEGGSIMSRVDGDVIVKHLTEVEESHIMKQEYGRAKENFRNVSKLKKAVDTRRSGRGGGAPTSPAASALKSMSRPAPKPREPKPLALESLAEAQVFTGGNAIEDAKTLSTLESIRSFVRAAQANWNIVPIRNGNVALSPAEVDAFRAESHGEKSFRGDYATLLTQAVAIFVRMTMELEDYNSKRDSAYLWKPHADALTYLISAAGRVLSNATAVLAIAEQRGLVDKAKALNVSLDRMKNQTGLVAKALQS
ncbi:MAG: hypothetical protein M3O85_05915 [Acidobacteriota bacterium]|nr:hypothetical protein [Acidobacteriota bacterium]